jgi:hypothetical protein
VPQKAPIEREADILTKRVPACCPLLPCASQGQCSAFHCPPHPSRVGNTCGGRGDGESPLRALRRERACTRPRQSRPVGQRVCRRLYARLRVRFARALSAARRAHTFALQGGDTMTFDLYGCSGAISQPDSACAHAETRAGTGLTVPIFLCTLCTAHNGPVPYEACFWA